MGLLVVTKGERLKVDDTSSQDIDKGGLGRLREPFPSEFVGKLPKPTKKQTDEVRADFKKGVRCVICGGWHHPNVVHLDYVGHAALTSRILDVDYEWNWEPMALNEMGLPLLDQDGLLWIKLTILGVTRIGCGDAGNKQGGDAMKERIGDALRNAGMRFGLALDLWHKDGDLIADGSFDSSPSMPEEVKARIIDGRGKGASIAQIAEKLNVNEKDVKSVLEE